MTLNELCKEFYYSTDKGITHRYLDTYGKLFAPFKDMEINLLEVGVATGGSLKLWEDYFSKAAIYGIDIINEIEYQYSERVHLIFEDIRVMKIRLQLDIAIDDGSHFVKDQLTFFNLIWPVMNKGGLLIIEDIDNIDQDKHFFDELNIPYEIIDLRGTYDSVLLIFRK